MDPHHFGNLDPHPDLNAQKKQEQDPEPHQCDKLDPEPEPHPHKFTDDKPKCMEFWI